MIEAADHLANEDCRLPALRRVMMLAGPRERGSQLRVAERGLEGAKPDGDAARRPLE